MKDTDVYFENLSINPDRVCEGISKIGYQPSSALMDIIDNSITAGATVIRVKLDIKEGSTLQVRDSVKRFRIIDNGSGMDREQILTALALGSIVDYPSGSLSKYGLGLKSAGFSLGDQVKVISKKAKVFSGTYSLNRKAIKEHNQYGVCTTDAVDDENIEELKDFENGTIIEITETANNQDSPNKIKRELQEKAGATYYYYLSNSLNPVSIYINCKGREDIILPKDILFWDDAYDTFDPDTYDGKRPCKVLDEFIDNPLNLEGEKYKLQICIFPPGSMKSFSQFSEEERNLIRRFNISRKNIGFFIYRNNRLIRWADKLLGEEGEGLVGKDDFGFRARILLTNEHDDLFHVDVSKQNLIVPEEVLDALRMKVNIPRKQWESLRKICNDLLRQDREDANEGDKASELLSNFNEVDIDANFDPPPPDEKKRRAKRRIQETESKKHESEDPSLIEESFVDESDIETFKKVRYSDKITTFDFWSAEKDTDYGPYVRINKMHSYYRLVLESLPPSDPTRVAIETMLYCLAAAENITVEDYSSLSYEDVVAVLNRFRCVFSYNLNSWANKNQNLHE
jgi:hypothetical protein